MDKVDWEQGAYGRGVQPDSSRSDKTRPRLLKLVAFLGLALLVRHFWSPSLLHNRVHEGQGGAALALDDLCPQVEALVPLGHEALLRSVEEAFGSSEFKLKAYESLGGAVRIPTECYDDMGLPSEDPRWEILAEFHKYLESRFPKVHANFKRTKVNIYSLVYEWKGTEDVKPLMLTAHMDVVPVNPDTYNDWVHPPYSGYYDGKWIWGRGASDNKGPLIAMLTAIETLLEHGFVPSRTILLSFGADEEGKGKQGARMIAQYLDETYGSDSLAMIVDEGEGFMEVGGVVLATPAIAEKGYMDVQMDVLTPGGHSSTPPKHTGIGILANLIGELEAHPYQPKLIRGSPYYRSVECMAKHDTNFPESLAGLLLESQTSDEKLRELGNRLVDFDRLYYVLSGTTQAIDLVGGGVKVNALPESAWAVINYRVADFSSLSELMARITAVVLPVAVKHNMTLDAFGEKVGPQGPSWGTIRLYDFDNGALSPSPVTPTVGSGPYELLSGTIRSTFQTHLRSDDLPKAAVVAPLTSTANTDTKYYWNLTRHIFRYQHRGKDDVYNGIHTINEAIRGEAFLEQIRFFTRLVLNADQSDVLE